MTEEELDVKVARFPLEPHNRGALFADVVEELRRLNKERDPMYIIDAAYAESDRKRDAATILAALIQGNATLSAAADTATPRGMSSEEIASELVPIAVALTDALRVALRGGE